MKKKFMSFLEQISILRARGLNILDANKLIWYLKAYNYQNLINGYNDLFMKNEDRKINKYKNIATSEGIIELFNFDRNISKVILSSIQNIERMLSTAIAYTIAKILCENGYDDGNIFSIKNNDTLLKKIFVINENNNGYHKIVCSLENMYNRSKNDRIFSKYSSLYEIPIWTIILHCSFGTLIDFLENINKKTYFSIIKNSTISNCNCLTKKEFISIIQLLKSVRNRICHNNVLYNICISNVSKKNLISKVINKKLHKHKNTKLNLYNICQLIECMEPRSDNFITDYICKKIMNFKNIDNSIVNLILEKIWIKKS